MCRLTLITIVVFALTQSQAKSFVEFPNGRIVGGHDVTIEEFPHQISLQIYGRHNCGGSILNPTTILTAAHCVDNYRPAELNIVAGSSRTNSGGITIKVKSFKVHGLYDSYTINNDIALITLEKPLEFGESIQPIKLPKQGEIFEAGTIATISGWGRLKYGGSSPKVLQAVEVQIVDRKDCVDAYSGGDLPKVTNAMICAGKGGYGSCHGDSGGPMIINDTIIGLVSWAYECAHPEYPSVLTRIANFRNWIDDNVEL